MSMYDETDPTKIVDTRNEFFASIGPKLASKIESTDLEVNNQPYTAPQLLLTETTPEEVENLLLKISDSKATGEGGLPVRFLKLSSKTTSTIIACSGAAK